MRVVVTGGSGRLGQWVVRDLLLHGHEVVNIDRRRPSPGVVPDDSPRPPFREVDLSNVGQVAGALFGSDAVVHLGAIPAPYRHPDEVVFGNNTGSTFAVLQAASIVGLRKAVIASSISIIGAAYAVHPFKLSYAPADEEHPLLGQDAYALSKEADERTAQMFHRRTGISVLAMRFHWVSLPGEAAARASQSSENPGPSAHQLWGYVDVRDAAQACRLGIETDGLGFEIFNVTAADTLIEQPTEEAIRQYAPETEIRRPLQGTESGWSIEKARRLLGYDPKHSWRDGTGA